jgi:predicted nucleic acid-binding protein
MPVLDTSVLVPAFDADHPRHHEARELLAAPALLHVNAGVLGELTTVLRRRANDVGLEGSKVARDALAKLESLAGFRHATSYDPDTVSHVYRAHSSLSYVDAIGIVLALELDEELLTFDDGQAAALKRERRKRS